MGGKRHCFGKFGKEDSKLFSRQNDFGRLKNEFKREK